MLGWICRQLLITSGAALLNARMVGQYERSVSSLKTRVQFSLPRTFWFKMLHYLSYHTEYYQQIAAYWTNLIEIDKITNIFIAENMLDQTKSNKRANSQWI